ncbi:MAG: hypothetical protein CMN55_08725 [Sneathiella sp.]|uniref:VCBS domain-containing protein n=1 Tax=Sneathiella sp. TaxID=1964365 RepID=UPI000C62A692|nr:VCBS domain-containing protein [Sneathiella sp.]MAL79179.1 hypothetical protein [Sneathiella sp.]
MAIELTQSDLENLETEASAFGSGTQNLGRGDKYFSMTSMTLSATFSLNDLTGGRQYIYNNHLQTALYVHNDDLVVRLNTENGSFPQITLKDVITDAGWHDVQVILDDEAETLEVWLDGKEVYSGSGADYVVGNASYWDVTAGGTPWGSELNGQIANVTVLDHAVTIDPDDSLVERMENIKNDAYVSVPDDSTDTPDETPEEDIDQPDVTPPTDTNKPDVEILESAASQFGSSYQNLGRSAEYFSMTNMTIGVTFSLNDLSGGRQYLVNNHMQYALYMQNDDLIVQLNTESGQFSKLTFKDVVTETGWHDVQVIVDADNGTLKVYFDGNEIYTGSSEGIMIENAKYWDVTTGGTPWGSALDGQIADVTILDKAVSIDSNDSIAERMQSVQEQGNETGSKTPTDPEPDNGNTTDPDNSDGGNSEATISGVHTGEVTEDVDLTSSGKLTATDPDPGEGGFQEATMDGDYGEFVIDEKGNWTYTLTESDDLDWLDTGDTVTETFTVKTIDGTTAEVVVNVNGRDEPGSNTGGSNNNGGGNGGGSPSAGQIQVSTTAELLQALSGDVAGYTIVLAPGEYNTINLNGYNFSSPVTITSANPNNPAHFESITVNNSSNMVFDNLEISSYDAASAAWGENMFSINNSSDIVVSNNTFGNDVDGAMYNGFYGIRVTASEDVTVEDNEFKNLHTGAHFRDSNGLTVTGNEFHDLRTDGATFTGVQNVMIDGNSFKDFYHVEGDHSDYVQFYATTGLQANTDITISNNLMVQGNGYDAQAIFMTSTAALPMENVAITNNIIYQSGWHGITVGITDGLEISENTVVSPPDSASGYIVWIQVNGVTNGVIENNISNSYYIENSSVSDNGNIVAYIDSPPWNVGSNPAYSYSELFNSNLTIRSVDADDFETGSRFNVGVDINLLSAANSITDLFSTAFADLSTNSIDDLWDIATGGNDYIEGTSAVDAIFGFDGNDELFGFDGDDILVGGNGADKLTGGKAADTFVFSDLDDSGIGAGNRDVITDFNSAEGDILSFEGLATDNFDYSFDNNSKVLSVDLDGDFVIDMEVQLLGVNELDNSDFLV